MTGRNRFLLLIVSAWISTAVLSELLVPRLIQSAYRGESLPALNRIISGQSEHGVDFYVQRWHSASRPALGMLGLAALLAALLTRPPVERRLAAWLTAHDVPGGPEPVMPAPRRRRLVYFAVLVLIAGSLAELIADPPYHREHWPFSQYQMYSKIHRGPVAALRVFGVTAGDPPRELPLEERKFIQPFDHSRLWVSLERMNWEPDRDRLIRTALADCLRRYENLRRAGRHDGPPLRALRLYRLRWTLDFEARTLRPLGRELLYEVTSSTPKVPSS